MANPITEHFGKTLELTEIVIELGEGTITDRDASNDNLKPKQEFYMGSKIPVVKIKDFVPALDELKYFKLDLTNKIPHVEIVLDLNTANSYDTNLTDGDIISIVLKDQSPNIAHIQNDYTIDDIDESPNNIKISISGEMNIPKLHSSINKAYIGTSYTILQTVAEELGLGFSSNFEETDDEMTWIASNETYYQFIQKVIDRAWIDDEHYVDWYIDQHYHLVLYENGDTLTETVDTEVELFLDNINSINDDLNESTHFDWTNTFTNVGNLKGTNFFVENYKRINNSKRLSKKNGYVNKFYFLDYEDLEEFEFETQTISDSDNGVPLKGLENDTSYLDEIKVHSLGMQNPNMHPQYYYAYHHNKLNNKELEKVNVEIKVSLFNLLFVQGNNVYLEISDDRFDMNLPEINLAQLRNQSEGRNVALSLNYKIQGMYFEYKKGVTNTYYILTRREFPSTIEE